MFETSIHDGNKRRHVRSGVGAGHTRYGKEIRIGRSNVIRYAPMLDDRSTAMFEITLGERLTMLAFIVSPGHSDQRGTQLLATTCEGGKAIMVWVDAGTEFRNTLTASLDDLMSKCLPKLMPVLESKTTP